MCENQEQLLRLLYLQRLQSAKLDLAILAMMGLGNDYFPAVSYKSFEQMWQRYIALRAYQPSR